MCGFTGSISFNKINNELIKKANTYSICRGPDNQKNFKGSEEINFDLWFNRLSIVDLNENANQPMVSQSYNSILLFNGEIYNSDNLRNNLLKDKYNFKTSHSDTETLLAGLNLYGIEFVSELEGQFAFVYWNRDQKQIFLARDRVGQKPLYYNFDNQSINFASNLKSLAKVCGNTFLSNQALKEYLNFGAVFSPNTIFNNYFKVEPGKYLSINYQNNIMEMSKKTYWQVEDYFDNQKFDYHEFNEIFSQAVSKRLISDVPVANFLSGGIDSTSIIKNLSDNGYEINTFSATYDNEFIDESMYINEVVEKYKTEHISANIDKEITNDLIFEALNSLDEPYGDPSVVPSYNISKLISEKYKVAISGDGGDELLGGYPRVKNHLLTRSSLKNFYSKFYNIFPYFLGTGSSFLSFSNNEDEAYLSNLEDKKVVKAFTKSDKYSKELKKLVKVDSKYKSYLINDYYLYLYDQMMFKVDRTSMANSIEVRSPFVDHKLIEYVLSHTYEYLDTNISKFPLIKYLQTDFDEHFLHRQKQGFVFDYEKWIYTNADLVKNTIQSSQISAVIDVSKLNLLLKVKTRINSLRLWRLFVLCDYFNSFKYL